MLDHVQQGMWVRTLWDPVKEKRQSPLEAEEGIIRVAAYCRVSTTLEVQLRSLENQVSHYTHLIRGKPNWKFVGVYVDNGSGASPKSQRGLKRLLRHCEEGRVDFILTKNISRLSRNAEQTLSIIEKLKAWKVGLYFEKEQIDTSIEYNKFLLSTYAALAQDEVETISTSTRWGFEKNFKQGIPRFNKMLGYDVGKKEGKNTLEINKEGAIVIRRIFDWCLQGMSTAEIARKLMSQGVKTSVGKELWRGSTVKHILTNVTYTGNKLTRVRTKDLFTDKQIKHIRDQIAIQNCHPPIISMDVFEQAQKQLEKRKRTKKDNDPNRKKHALSGRLTCHRCGYRMSNYPTRGVNYWKCNTTDSGYCDHRSIREDRLKGMLLEGLKRTWNLEDPSVLTTLKKILLDVNQKDHFEFHRLKWMAELELAKAEQEDLTQLEQEYHAFETRIAKIEDDRPYRNQTLTWLEDIHSVEAFLEHVTIEHLRAWVMALDIHSINDYRMEWVDGTETLIGELPETEAKGSQHMNANLQKTFKQTEHEPLYELLDANGQLRGRGEEDMPSLLEREVIKIEPQKGTSMLKTIEANLLSHPPKASVNPETRPLRTAAYCRVSTDKEEQLTSYKTQVAYYTYLILKDPRYAFAGIFADEGISGKSLKNREEFKKLMDECRKGHVDLILCKSISRFSRNTLETLKAVRWLKSLSKPVYIFFEKENIHTKDTDSELMLTIFGSIAQEESVNIGNSISWGKRSQAERGIIHVGTANYGYRIGKNYQWEVHEEEAMIVRRIYADIRAGKNYSQIQAALTRERIPTPKGKGIWSLSTVKGMLKNVVYRGDYLYQKYYTVDTLEDKVATNQGELPQYYIEGHHEAIIDPKEWEEVQAILEERSTTFTSSRSNKYLAQTHKNEAFIQKLECGECGRGVGYSRAVEKRREDEPYEVHRWVCRLAEKYYAVDGCASRRFQQPYLEQHFINMVKGLYQNEAFQEEVKNVIAKTALSEEEQILEDRMHQQMEKLNQALYEAVDEELHQDGQDSQRVDELSGEIVKLHQQLKAFSDRKKLAEDYKLEYKELMKKVKVLYEQEHPAFPTEVYSQFVEQAIIFKDGKIVYHLNLGVKWTTEDRYDQYRQQLLDEKKARTKAERKKKHEDFLKGPEVAALLEYCEKPRMWGEVLAFMNRMLFISDSHLRSSVITPLFNQGKLVRDVIPGSPSKRKLYMVKK